METIECDHCGESFTYHTWSDPDLVGWCSSCCITFRRFLKAAGLNDFHIPISGHPGVWTLPDNVKKVRSIPKRPRTEPWKKPAEEATISVVVEEKLLQPQEMFCYRRYYGLKSCACKDCPVLSCPANPRTNPFGYER